MAINFTKIFFYQRQFGIRNALKFASAQDFSGFFLQQKILAYVNK
jgi:hypothetical protein